MKICNRCGIEKPFTEFYKRLGNTDGFAGYCKKCRKKYVNKLSQDHKKKVKASWYQQNKDVVKTYVQNRRAKIKSCSGKLSVGLKNKLFVLQKGKCPCCNQPLGNDYHLDHIMPLSLGGTNTDDNIQLLRASCNRQKWAKHPVDFMSTRGFLL